MSEHGDRFRDFNLHIANLLSLNYRKRPNGMIFYNFKTWIFRYIYPAVGRITFKALILHKQNIPIRFNIIVFHKLD